MNFANHCIPLMTYIFQDTGALILKFIGQSKKLRIQYSLLNKNKAERGLTVSDFKTYYQEVVLTWILDWIYHSQGRCQERVEEIHSNIPLEKVIWILQKFGLLCKNASPLTVNVFKILDTIQRQFKWDCKSSLLFLISTNYFPPGNEDSFFSMDKR